MADRYTVRKETLEAIADKIREKKYIDDPMTPAQMVEEMDELHFGGYTIDVDTSITVEPWVRPAEYPDPTVLDLTDFDGLYLTYDLRKTPGYGWIGIYATLVIGRQRIYIERGHIENAIFVVDDGFDMASGGYFRQELNIADGEVQLWRVHSDGHFRRFSFVTNTATTAKNYVNSLQPAVERYGRLPYVSDISGTPNSASPSYGTWGTWFLERDDVKDVTEVTTMSGSYNQCHQLRELYMDGWDTSKVTTFNSCFNDCYRLRSIPLEKIHTDSATSLAYMFSDCRSLDNVNINHFNIDKVTTMGSMFYLCCSLKHLEMSELTGTGKLITLTSFMSACYSLEDITRNVKNLNVSNVTSLASAFASCANLRDLDLSSWNTAKVTSLSSMCDYCRRLEKINVSGWDVSKVMTMNAAFRECFSLREIVGLDEWELLAITNLSSAFASCVSLERFKIKTWDISNLTTSASMFVTCRSLKEVDLTDWDVPNVITSAASMFQNCQSLKRLHLPNMDFTTSVALSDFIGGCLSLDDLDLSNWHVAHLTAFGGFFSACYRLLEIDLTSWTVDNGELGATNTLNSTFANLRNCESIKIHFPLELASSRTISTFITADGPLKYFDIRNWDLSNASNSYTPNNPVLEDYYPPQLYPINQTYSAATALTPDSLVRILEALPEVAANSRTITLGINKLKLTDEQLAIATDKGWKVA